MVWRFSEERWDAELVVIRGDLQQSSKCRNYPLPPRLTDDKFPTWLIELTDVASNSRIQEIEGTGSRVHLPAAYTQHKSYVAFDTIVTQEG